MAFGQSLRAVTDGIAEWMPYTRASYVHEATTPRVPLPPTMTGLPASPGSSRTSTEAKKESMSTCRMAATAGGRPCPATLATARGRSDTEPKPPEPLGVRDARPAALLPGPPAHGVCRPARVEPRELAPVTLDGCDLRLDGLGDVDPDVRLEGPREIDGRHLVRRPGVREVVRQRRRRGDRVEERPAAHAVVPVVEVLLPEEDGGRVVPEHHVGLHRPHDRHELLDETGPLVELTVVGAEHTVRGEAHGRGGGRHLVPAPAREVRRRHVGVRRPATAVGADDQTNATSAIGPAGERPGAGHVGVVWMRVDGEHDARHRFDELGHWCERSGRQTRCLGSVVLMSRPTSRWKSPASSKPL